MKMKKMMIVSTCFSIAVSFMLLNQPAKAFTDNSAIGKASIKFKPSDSATLPVNPLDPTNAILSDRRDPLNPATEEKGQLTIDTFPLIKFSGLKTSYKDQTFFADNLTPFVQVTDKRGNGEGWRLSARLEPFRDSNGKAVKGIRLNFLNGKVASASRYPDRAPSTQKLIRVDDTADSAIMTAKSNAGRGTWIQVWNQKTSDTGIQLEVLGDTVRTETYKSAILWTLTESPQSS